MSLPIQCIKRENIFKKKKKKKAKLASERAGNPEGGSLDMSAVRGRKKREGGEKKRDSLRLNEN